MPKWTKARPVKPKPLGEEDYPTVDEINELPDKFRRYIHEPRHARRQDRRPENNRAAATGSGSTAKAVEELEAEVASLSAKLRIP